MIEFLELDVMLVTEAEELKTDRQLQILTTGFCLYLLSVGALTACIQTQSTPQELAELVEMLGLN